MNYQRSLNNCQDKETIRMGINKPLVLIVDDNPQNRQFLGNLLHENGYDLGMAQDGETALNFVENEQPDLILLDIMMPGMDGYEVCETLKAELSTRYIPVIFLTAKAETDDIVRGFEVGGSDYVTKPFNGVELLARIKTHIEMKRLKGILPICSYCKMIRNDEGQWELVDAFIHKHSEAKISHGLCPACMKKHHPEAADEYFSK